MPEIRRVPSVKDRVETGPLEFDGDWPGVFIRGDNAAYYAMILHSALQQGTFDPLLEAQLKDLKNVLSGCIVGPAASFFDDAPDAPIDLAECSKGTVSKEFLDRLQRLREVADPYDTLEIVDDE